jgi:hypothetical protein
VPPRQFLLAEASDGLGQPMAPAHSAPNLDTALVEALPLTGAPARGGYLLPGCTGCEVTAHLEPLDGCLAAVLMHENGCDRLAEMLARAGKDSQ